MKRKLPVYVERAIGAIAMERTRCSITFEAEARRLGRITCETGCASCCHYPIEISLFEAVPIYQFLIARGRWTPAFQSKLEEHAKSVSLLSSTIWLLSRIPCPLLEKNRCLVYESRPFACRTLLSLGDPHYCDPHRFSLATKLVPRDEATRHFEEFELAQGKQIGAPMYRVPLSRALLFAQRLMAGDLDMDGLLMAFYADYKESQ